MKNTRLNVRRALSVILALTMVLTTVVFFNIGASAATASAITVTDNGSGNPVYLYVPEQIYLKPSLNSYKTQDKYNFQWFVDSSVNESSHAATTNTGERATGNFYFYYADASKVTVSYKFLKKDMSEMTAFTSPSDSTGSTDYANSYSTVTFSNGQTISAYNTRTSSSGSQMTVNSNTVNVQLTREGLSPYLLAGTSGCYIEWQVRYTDKRDGLERIVYAYTYLYKPYIAPVGSAVRCAEEYYDDHYNAFLAWVSGVHTSASGSYYAKSGGGGGSFVPFSSSNTDGYLRGNLYMQFSTSSDGAANNYFDWSADNNSCKNWIDGSSSTYFTTPTINYGSDASNNPSGVAWDEVYAYTFVASPLATITVDNSRYTNLNQIPNLSVGLMITDDEASESGGAQFIKNYSTGTSSDGQGSASGNQKNSHSTSDSYWNGATGAAVFTAGTYGSGGTSEAEGVKFNGKWARSISSSSSSGRYDLRAGVWNQSGGDWTTGVAGIHVQVNMKNNGKLRTSLANAYKVSCKFGLDSNLNSAYYSSSTLSSYNALIRAAGLMLTALDRTPTVSANGTNYTSLDSLATALDNAVSAIENGRLSSTAKARFVGLEKDDSGNYVTANVISAADNTAYSDSSKSYKYANTVKFDAPVIAGYNYVGYAETPSTAYGQNVGMSYNTLIKGTETSRTVSYVRQGNIGYTFFYVPKDITATVKTTGGIYNLLRTQTGDAPAGLGTVSFPIHTENPSVETDFGYRIKDNDVIACTAEASTAQKYAFLPFYAELEPKTSYKLTYSVAGADASDIEFSFYNASFFGGDAGNTTTYTVSSDGTFTTGAYDIGIAYLKMELSGNARSGKEFRVCDLCLTPADQNEIYMDTASGYPAVYNAPSTDKTGMNYMASSLDRFTVTSRYSTIAYNQRQLLPFYIDIQPGCQYTIDYDAAGIDPASVKFELYSANFSGGNSSNGVNYYSFSGSGSTVTIGVADSGVAQLRISFVPNGSAAVAAGTTATITNLYMQNLNSQTVIPGKNNKVIALGIPVRDGYKFSGWTLRGAQTSTPFGVLTPYPDTVCFDYKFGVDSDFIEAAWTNPTYTVVFRNTDGEELSRQEVAKGANASAPSSNPTLFGHTFAGWDTEYTNVQGHLYIEPVYENIDIDVILSKASASFYAGSTDTVSASFSPNEAEISNVVWTSSNEQVATVAGSGTKNANAVITGVKAGTATITATVTYDGRTYSESMPVTVNAVLPTAVELINPPAQTSYFIGDTFDPSGLSLKVTYNNGTQQTVNYPDSRITLSTVSMSTAGNKTLTVTFKEGSFTQKVTTRITVTRVAVESIAVTNPPAMTEYFVGDTELDLSGIEVTAYYNNGTSVVVPLDEVSFSDLQAAAAGTESIIVSYSGKTTTFDVVINNVILESIAIKNLPKTSYFVGDEASYSGLVLTATYNNGDVADITSGYTTSGFDSSTTGQKTITVTYEGKTATYNINVSAVQLASIAVKDMPKTEYFVGDEASYTGLTLTATYNNGSTQTVASGFTTSGFDSSAAGQKTITVTYEGKTTTYTVNVTAIELVSLAVKTAPAKTTYFVGDNADYTGLVLTATYNNGDVVDVTEGYTLSGFDSATAGQKTVTATYEGKTATFNMTVNAIELVSLAVKTAPAKTTYFVGDDADYTGLVLTATYNNGDVADVTEGYTLSGFDSETAGTKTVTATFGGKTATFSMTVNPVELTDIEIVNEPAKKTYLTGDEADFTGLKIKANYNNGTSEELTTGFTTSGFDSETAGQKTITVTYGGKTAQFSVTVNWNLADYDAVDAAIASVPADTSIYTADSVAAVTAAVNNVVRGKTVDEQAAVDAMAEAISSAVAALQEKPLNTAEYEAAQNAEHKDFALCTDASVAAVTDAKNAADTFLANNNRITKQAEFDALTAAYKAALAALEYKPANYEDVDALLELLDTLNPEWFENWDDIYWTYICGYAEDYIPANHDYTIDRQADVYEMADTLQDYINMLELKLADYSAVIALQQELAAKKTSGLYTDESIAEAESYFEYIEWDLPIMYQGDIDSAALELANIVATVPVLKDADYSAVNAKVDYINALAENFGVDEDGTEYVNFDDIYWNYMTDCIDNIDYSLKADRQSDVDAIAAELQSYIDMLETAADEPEYFEFVEGVEVIEQGGVNYVGGFRKSMSESQLERYFDYENVEVEYEASSNRFGTGSTITVTYSNGDTQTYVIIIYGDVNGDAKIDSEDASLLEATLNGTEDPLAGAYKLAANISGSNAKVNDSDLTALADVAAGALELDQTTGKVVEE